MIRARGADFRVGGLMQTRKREQSRGSGGMPPWENLKFKYSEKARNATKIANNNENFCLLYPTKTTSYKPNLGYTTVLE